MDIRELTYFLTAAEEGNISRAADKLYIAQSTLSHFIHQFETELGTKLFVRTNRGIQLTATGNTFFLHAKNMVSELEQAKKEISDIECLQTGEIRLGISSFRGTYILPKVLKKFNSLYPGISVIVTELDSVNLEEEILNYSLDMALVAYPLKNKLPSIVADICIHDEVCLIASPTHPIIKKAFRKENSDKLWINPSDIAEYTFIYSAKHTILGTFARKLFGEHNIVPKHYPADISPVLALGLVKSEIGVAFSYLSWSAFFPDIVYLSISTEPNYVDLALIYPPSGYQSNAVKALSQIFHEYDDLK